MQTHRKHALGLLFAVASAALGSSSAFALEITIAQVAAFTGAQASSGKAIRAGIKLYIDKVNRSGGIDGTRIRFITRDDEYKSNETVKIVKEVIEQEAPTAFIAALGTANVEALIKDGVLVRANVPLVGAISGASSMIGAPNVFVTKAAYRDEINELFELVSRSGVKRAAIFYQNDSFGNDVLESAEAAAPKLGINIVARAPYERNTTNVEEAVARILKSDAQFVYLGAVTSAATAFIKAYRAGGGTAQICGVSVIDPTNLLKTLGPDVARGYAFGALAPLTGALKFAIIREFHELRKESNDPDLAERSVEGFITAKTLIHALRESRGASRSAVLKSLQTMRGVDLGDYWIDFSSKGRTGSQFVEFAIIGANGRIEH